MHPQLTMTAPLSRWHHRSRPLAQALVAVVVLAFAGGLIVLPSASGQSLEDKQAQARDIAARLDELTQRYERLADEADSAETDLAQVGETIAQMRARLDETVRRRDTSRGELQAYAVDAYLSGSDDSTLTIALGDGGEDELPVRLGYLESISGNRAQLIDQLGAAELDVEARLDELKASEVEAERLSQTADAARDEAQAAIDEQQQLQSETDAEINTLIEQQRERDAQQRQAAALAVDTSPQPTSGTPPPDTPNTTPDPGPPAPSLPPAPAASGAAGAVAAATSRLGAPYVWAAAGPDTFDCSGLTMWAWAQVGRSLPHNSGAQFSSTRRVTAAQLQPGDLVFYFSPISHVSMYIGGGQIVDAPHSGATVRITSMGYPGTIVGYGRP